MALQPQQIEAIAAAVTLPPALDLVTQLRTAFPGISFTLCDDDDIIGARPVLERPGFNLYLVDASDHCMKLTRFPEHATGVVVAMVEEET